MYAICICVTTSQSPRFVRSVYIRIISTSHSFPSIRNPTEITVYSIWGNVNARAQCHSASTSHTARVASGGRGSSFSHSCGKLWPRTTRYCREVQTSLGLVIFFCISALIRAQFCAFKSRHSMQSCYSACSPRTVQSRARI